MTQPSVSKSIAQLEESLGVRLLMRSTRGMTTTEAGRSFCEQARRVIEQADEAVQAVRSVGSGLQGRLRVSAGTAAGKLHLMPLLPAFLKENPNLSIDLVLDDRSIDLIGEGIDLGLCLGPLRNSSLTARKLTSRKRMVLSTPAYFEAAGVPTTPTELSRHAAVICTYEREGSDTWCFRQGNTELSISVSGRLRVNTSEGLRAAVLSGMGLANASQWMFEVGAGVRSRPCSARRLEFTRKRVVGGVPRRADAKRQSAHFCDIRRKRIAEASSGPVDSGRWRNTSSDYRGSNRAPRKELQTARARNLPGPSNQHLAV